MSKERVQSIAISEIEQTIIFVLAKSQGIKPATAARHLLMRGLGEYLKDRSLRPAKFDEEIINQLNKLILSDKTLRQAKLLVEAEIKSKRPRQRQKSANSLGSEFHQFPAETSLIGQEVELASGDVDDEFRAQINEDKVKPRKSRSIKSP